MCHGALGHGLVECVESKGKHWVATATGEEKEIGGWVGRSQKSKQKTRKRYDGTGLTWSQHRIRGKSWKDMGDGEGRTLLMWVGCCSGYFVGKSDVECKHSSFCFLSTVTSPFCLEKSIFCPLSRFTPRLQHFAFISEPVIILQPFCNTRYFNLIRSAAYKSCCRHFSKT